MILVKKLKPNKDSYRVLLCRAIGPLIVYIFFIGMIIHNIGGSDSWEFLAFVVCLPLTGLLTCLVYVILLRVNYSLEIRVDPKEIRIEEYFSKKRKSYNFKPGETFRARIVAGGGLPHVASSKDLEFGHYLSGSQHLEILEILNALGSAPNNRQC